MDRIAGKVMLLGGWRRAFLAIFAGAIGALALPPFGFFAILFVSFTLFVWLMDGSTASPGSGMFGRLRSAFFLGWLFGFGYFVAGLWWLGNALLIEADEFAWALPLAILGLPAFLGLYYGVAAVLARVLWSDGLGRIAALAAAFGLIEWARSFLLTGFPWNAIGYGAMPVPIMMQSAHFAGVFGVTAIAVFVFAAPALIATRKGMVAGLLLAAVFLCAHIGYGAYRLSLPAKTDGREITIRLVQPSIEQAAKLQNTDRLAIFEQHLALSARPVADGAKRPDLIVWPETSIPFLLTQNQDALVKIADLLEDGQILVTGAVRAEDAGAGSEPRYYNSIYAIDSQGQIIAAADKVHLTPFGEYVPFEDILRKWGVESMVSLPGGFTAARKRTTITLPGGEIFYPLICYEIIFPGEMDKDIAGANAILNLTNDAWFGDTPGPYQHFLQARIRAVENAIPLIRNANSGISAFVDAKGRIISGLSYNEKSSIDATISSVSEGDWNSAARNIHFWLIILGFAMIALVSRLSFIFRNN